MEITKIQDISSQKGYKINDRFFVAYEGNAQFDANNNDYIDCLNWITNGGIVETEFSEEQKLENIKITKISELKRYYESSECWLFKVKSTQLGASITKDADWFAKMLPAINGAFFLITDAGVPIQVNLTAEQARLINNKINVEMSLSINTQKKLCEEAIENAETIENVEAIDVKSSLGNIPRVVDIDNII